MQLFLKIRFCGKKHEIELDADLLDIIIEKRPDLKEILIGLKEDEDSYNDINQFRPLSI